MSEGYSILVDTSKCTACRGCQMACKQWNQLPATQTRIGAATRILRFVCGHVEAGAIRRWRERKWQSVLALFTDSADIAFPQGAWRPLKRKRSFRTTKPERFSLRLRQKTRLQCDSRDARTISSPGPEVEAAFQVHMCFDRITMARFLPV